MSVLANRKTRAIVEFSDCIRERGKLRPICMELSPYGVRVRLKGLQGKLRDPLSLDIHICCCPICGTETRREIGGEEGEEWEMNKWISVKDRLRGGEELVLIWRTDRKFHFDTGQCFFATRGPRYWGCRVSRGCLFSKPDRSPNNGQRNPRSS